MFIKPHQKTALVWKDLQVSYSQFIQNVNSFSKLFHSGNGDKVAIFSENKPEWVYAFYAAWKNDRIAVPIDFMATAEEVAYILNDCRPDVIFCSEKTENTLRDALKSVNHKIHVNVFEKIQPPEINGDAVDFPDADLQKTAVIIYTSGTTGSPKGVMLSYDNLLANIEAVSNDVKIYTPDDKVMALLPFHHIFPLLGTMVAPLYVGATIVFSPSMVSEDIMATLQDNGVTIIIGVPRLYSLIRKGIMDKINKNRLAKSLFAISRKVNSQNFSRRLFKQVHQKFGGHLKYMVSGGAKLDEEVGKDFKTLGFEVLEGFGMTEAAPMITFTRPGRVKVGSAGEMMSCTEVQIKDGEIIARGRNIMQGYYKRPQETAEVIRDGWLHTGDLGHLDEKGYIHVTGRRKEILVLSNGKNVNPVEIEFKLSAMSDIIQEVAVFLKDDVLYAAIYPDFKKVNEEGIANLQEKFRWDVIDQYNQHVSPYKKIMKFLILKDELPKTRLGKIKRFMLSELVETGPSKQNIDEPKFEEYFTIKEYLQHQTTQQVAPDDHIEIDLGLDSLDKVSFQTFLQSTFGVDVKEDFFVKNPTVEKISNYMQEKKSKLSVEAVKWAEIFKEKIDIKLPKSWFTQNLFRNVSKVFLKLYFRLKGEGTENLPESPFIIAPNHQSFFDGLFVAAYLKNQQMKKTYFYAKEKHIRKAWLKFLANRNNIIIMDVNKELKLSLQKMAEVLKKGRNIIIFPEGTRTKDGTLGNFKKTFAILSRELNVPVVPVSIKGAFDALPRGKKIPRPWKRIHVKFLEPVYPENHSYESLQEVVFQRLATELT